MLQYPYVRQVVRSRRDYKLNFANLAVVERPEKT